MAQGAELFGRVCVVTVGDREYSGVRTTFKVSRSTSGKPNQIEISLYNLAQDSRERMRVQGLPVRLVAGYEDASALIGSGDLWDARPVRDGTEITMVLRATDGDKGFRNQVRKSWTGGTPRRDVVQALADGMGLGIVPSSLDLVDGVFSSARVVSGPAAQALDRIALSMDLDWSIQDGQLLLVKRDGTTYEQAVVLERGSGLIGSPEQQERRTGAKASDRGLVRAVSLLNPMLRPGRAVALLSQMVSGKFRCDVVDHEGDTHDEGRWTSSCTLRPVK